MDVKKAITRLLDNAKTKGTVRFLEIRRLIPNESAVSTALETVWESVEKKGLRLEFSRPLTDSHVNPLNLLTREGTRNLLASAAPTDWPELLEPLVEDVVRFHVDSVGYAAELRNAGSQGVLRLIQLYSDPESSYRPSAFFCIEEAIQRWMADNLRTIQVPAQLFRSAERIKKVGELQDELGRLPTALEVASRLSIDEETAETLLRKFSNLENLLNSFGPSDDE